MLLAPQLFRLDLSTAFEKNLYLDVGLVSDLGRLFVFSRIPEYLRQ